MKRLIFFCLAFGLISSISPLTAQDQPSGYLGDNFSLEGALDVFKNSPTLEDFEEQLNSQNSDINNLDLNDDGDVDYIRIEDYVEGEIHVIILQALISEEESQDVAVIEVERTGNESATLQIVGNDYLYGEDYFVEPFDEVATSSEKGGPSANYSVSRIIVNVWSWPSVQHIYRPGYVVYRSPFRWRVYPRIWKPWRPLTWSVYHGKRVRYNHRYRSVNTHRIVRARTIYTPRKRSSTVVVKKSRTVTRVRKVNRGKSVAKNKTTSRQKTVTKQKRGTKKIKKKSKN